MDNVNDQDGKKEYYILCVDDDHTFLNSLNSILSKLTYISELEYICRIELVDDVNEMFELIEEINNDEEEIALIISDHKMPEMTGIELLEKVGKRYPEIAKVLLTGYAGLDSAKYAINNKILDQYVSKPIEDVDNFVNEMGILISKYHYKKEKEKKDIQLKIYLKELEVANRKITKMLTISEQLAYYAQDIKSLDLDEILNLTIKKVPPLFSAKKTLVILFEKYEDRYSLVNVSSNDIGYFNIENIRINIDKLTKKDEIIFINKDSEERYKTIFNNYSNEESSIFMFYKLDKTDKKDIKNQGSKKNISEIGCLMILVKPDIWDCDKNILNYKTKLIKDIIGANILNAKLFRDSSNYNNIKDVITGLYSSVSFFKIFQTEYERSKRYGRELCIAIFNLRDSRKLNEKYGYTVVDNILRDIAKYLLKDKRKSDLIARYNGCKFIYLIPETNVKGVKLFAPRIIKKINGLIIPGTDLKINLDMGLAFCSFNDDEDINMVVNAAENALAESIKSGKNTLIIKGNIRY